MFVLFCDVPRGGGVVNPPTYNSDVPRLENSQVRGESPKHLIYWTVNSLSIQIFITKASYKFGGFFVPLFS